MCVLKTIAALSFVLLLAACSDAQEPKNTQSEAQPTKEVVQPTPSNDDHHQGETNVAPHDDSMQQMMNDHHGDEENVEPHEHDDADTQLPPSRSRLEGTNDDHHAGEENVAPHND